MPPKEPVMTDAKAPCSPGRIFVLLRLLSGGPCGARSERGRSAESGQRPDSVPAETRRDASNAGSLSIRGGLQRLRGLVCHSLQYWPKADFGKISTLTYNVWRHRPSGSKSTSWDRAKVGLCQATI